MKFAFWSYQDVIANSFGTYVKTEVEISNSPKKKVISFVQIHPLPLCSRRKWLSKQVYIQKSTLAFSLKTCKHQSQVSCLHVKAELIKRVDFNLIMKDIFFCQNTDSYLGFYSGQFESIPPLQFGEQGPAKKNRKDLVDKNLWTIKKVRCW